MPNGVFPVPKFRHVPHARTRPSLAVRVRTRWRRNRLDEELAHGVDPATSAELSLRAAQLRSPAERARLANALVETLGDARRSEPRAFTVKARRQHAAIREYADDLLALVLRLRDDRPVDVRGAAIDRLAAERRSEPSVSQWRRGLAARAPRCPACPRPEPAGPTGPGEGSLTTEPCGPGTGPDAACALRVIAVLVAIKSKTMRHSARSSEAWR